MSQTHDPPRSNLDALITELLEALWWAESNYTSKTVHVKIKHYALQAAILALDLNNIMEKIEDCEQSKRLSVRSCTCITDILHMSNCLR